MKGCTHHWMIKDNKNHHQIGICKKCGVGKDFGINPTIINDRALITGGYNPLIKELVPYFEDREYQYPKLPKGFAVPFEPDENDEGYWDNLI